jgi:hypothetical protein
VVGPWARAENGRTRIEVTVRRRPKALKPRLISVMLAVFGRRVFRKDLERTLATIGNRRRAKER